MGLLQPGKEAVRVPVEHILWKRPDCQANNSCCKFGCILSKTEQGSVELKLAVFWAGCTASAHALQAPSHEHRFCALPGAHNRPALRHPAGSQE